jgi:hypothetical protein
MTNSSQLNQFKDKKDELREADRKGAEMANEFYQEQFFNKAIPGWLRFFMKRSLWLTRKLNYQMGVVGTEFPPKLILTKGASKKVLARNF